MVHSGPAIKVHVPLWITGSRHPNMAAIETHAPLGMSRADGQHPAGARALTARGMRVPTSFAVEAFPRRNVEIQSWVSRNLDEKPLNCGLIRKVSAV